MKERPILFNGEMVRAILDGRKTQTRRVIKPQPCSFWDRCDRLVSDAGQFGWVFYSSSIPLDHGSPKQPFPYGRPGDLLWVRETWAYKDGWTKPAYRADWKTPDKAIETMGAKWRPSIHMPRWVSRITLRVTDVRAERLQEIDEDSIVAEGGHVYGAGAWEWFVPLWDSINAPRGYSWSFNPWVWVVSFERV
jgi:hypothetical protein